MLKYYYNKKVSPVLTFNDKEICTCECHIEGENVMHCFPCCGHCYEKYINKDRTLNEESYENLIKN